MESHFWLIRYLIDQTLGDPIPQKENFDKSDGFGIFFWQKRCLLRDFFETVM